MKSVLIAGFVFLALFSFQSFSSPSYYCAKSFSEFKERWRGYADATTDYKINFLRENIQNPDIEIRKAVAREAVALEESSLNTIQILEKLALDSTLPASVREEIKSRILFHAQKASGKVLSEDLSPEQAVIEFKQAVVKKAVALATAENTLQAIDNATSILVEVARDSLDSPAFPVKEAIKSGILSIYKIASEKVIEDWISEYNIIFRLMVAFRKLGGASATSFMKSFKNHPLSLVRADAVFFTSDEDANEVIQFFLNDPNPVVQDQLVVKSIEVGNESALQELLKSSDILVRKRAEVGLKSLQSAEDPDLSLVLDTDYDNWINVYFKSDSEILKGIADRLLVSNRYDGIIYSFVNLFLSDPHKFLHLDTEGVALHLVRRIGGMKENYAEAMILFFEGGGSYDGRSPPPGLRQLKDAKIKQAVLEGMNRRPSTDLIELAGNEYFHEPFNGDKTFQKSIIQMANRRGGPFQERIFNHYTNTPYWRSFPEVDEMIAAGLKQVKASDWNDSYQSTLMNLIQKYKDNDSSTIAEELRALKKS